ncbi:MAG: NAD(P)H-hydrate dehydratase [Limnochordia bacterium]|nr:NAD(P)H-hydrate dehydratase [Limnochordia bacterium]
MRVVTAREMQAIDRAAVGQYGIPGIILMENAGLAIVSQVEKLSQDLTDKRVLVFAGPGNNGGDGFVVARHLHLLGARVRVYLTCEPEKITQDAAVNLGIVHKLGISVYQVEEQSLSKLSIMLRMSDLVVDAMLGTGARGPLSGIYQDLVKVINESGIPVVAVDIPTGVESDTGAVHSEAIRATVTVTFALPKRGLLLYPGASYTGRWHVADIGIPQELTAGDDESLYLVDETLVKGVLPRREPNQHKGDFGRVLVVGGSRGLSGAPTLAAYGAVRTGAGLVTLGGPASLNGIFATKLTEAMTLPLPDEDGILTKEAAAEIVAFCQRAGALAIGPGLSTAAGVKELIEALAGVVQIPTVIDADALNVLAEDPKLLALWSKNASVVITPHPGEMARLLDSTVEEITKDPIGSAQRAAGAFGCVVVLKGAPTIITTPQGQGQIMNRGNVAMATGGTGDVLTGCVAACLAWGLDAQRAAIAATYLHGLAGDLWAQDRGRAGLRAQELADLLPLAHRQVVEAPQKGDDRVVQQEL